MDKLRDSLIEAETRLKCIEEQCKYFENQAWIERTKIKELHKELHKELKNTNTTSVPNNLPKLVEGLKRLSKADLTAGVAEIVDDDCVFTGPIAWPSDYLINIVPTRIYICNICFDQINTYRWAINGVNFDLCQKCYDNCIRVKTIKLKDSKNEYLMSDFKKVAVN
jgi:hypothetical protein